MDSTTAKQVVVGGMFWASLAVVVAKCASLFSQLFLGKILSPEAYGILAVASTYSIIGAGFQNPGAMKLLIQQQSNFHRLAPAYLGFSRLLGTTGAVAVLLYGAAAGVLGHNAKLGWTIAAYALTVPAGAISAIYIAKASVQMRVRGISFLDAGASAISAVTSVAVASIGGDTLSIPVALLTSLIVQCMIYRFWLGKIETPRRVTFSEIGSILKNLRWLIASAFIYAITQRGDYLILGFILDPASLGFYYFAYLFVNTGALIVTMGIGRTFMPVFSILSGDERSLYLSFERGAGLVSLVGGVLCLGFIGLGPQVIHAAWSGIWDRSIIPASILASGMPLYILGCLSTVLLESRGQWRTGTTILAYEALSLIVFAAIGSNIGGLIGASTGVSIHLSVTGIVLFCVARRNLGDRFASALVRLLQLCAPLILAVPVVLFLTWMASNSTLPIVRGLGPGFSTFAALSLFCILTSVGKPALRSELLNLARNAAKRRIS